MSVCVCVSVCVPTFACPDDNSSRVPARITWFGRKDAKHFAPYCFGADWAWPSMSNLTSFYNSVYLHRFCVFEIFVRRATTDFVELFHIAHGATHILIPLYTHRQGRATDREIVYEYFFCETIGVLPALDSAIGSRFYKLLSVFAKSYSPHIPIFYITTSAFTETTVKQRSSAFICSSLTLRSGVSEVLFLARLSTHESVPHPN